MIAESVLGFTQYVRSDSLLLVICEEEERMTRSLSADLRGRVIAAIEEGLSTREAARRFQVGISTAGSWYRRYRDTGETVARKQGQPSRSKLDPHEVFILGLIEETPDITLPRSPSDWPLSTACEWFRRRCGCSLTSTASRSKKDGACQRAATSRRIAPSQSLVRRPT